MFIAVLYRTLNLLHSFKLNSFLLIPRPPHFVYRTFHLYNLFIMPIAAPPRYASYNSKLDILSECN